MIAQRCFLAVLFFSLSCLGQANYGHPTGSQAAPSAQGRAPAAQSKGASALALPDPAPGITADTPVITLSGFCEAALVDPGISTSTAPCQTVITRKEFEELARAVDPKMSMSAFRELADAYPRLLLMAREAHRRGLDSDARAQSLLRFYHLQLMARELGRVLGKESDQISHEAVETYYRDNIRKYEEFTLRHIYIPKSRQTDATRLGEPDMKLIADQIRAHAVAGEDFEKLQGQAFEAAGIKVPPPKTAMGQMTIDQLPRDRAAVFDLNPGQVSSVMADPAGYHVYKLESKSVKPLTEVEEAIRETLRRQNEKSLMDTVTQSAKTEWNRKYFHAFEKPVEFGGPESEETGDLVQKPMLGPTSTKPTPKPSPDSSPK